MKEDAQLLAELARLIDRYGPERFARLASVLRNPEEARELATVVEGALVVRRSTNSRKGQANQTPLGSRILEILKKSEPEKYQLLASFRDDFAAGKILSSMRLVRGFADENGIVLGSVSSRDKAITPLLRSMAALPLSRVQTLVQETAREQADDRSLASWSDVIMGRGVKPPSSCDHSTITQPGSPSSINKWQSEQRTPNRTVDVP